MTDTMTSKRVAVVTGGMGGLGEAIAVRLHADGFTVAVTHSQHNDHVGAWLDSQRAAGRAFAAYAVDVSDYDSCQQCAGCILADVGRVDILINNAGITRDKTFRRMSADDWHAVLHT